MSCSYLIAREDGYKEEMIWMKEGKYSGTMMIERMDKKEWNERDEVSHGKI